jgi:hypothetical protein
LFHSGSIDTTRRGQKHSKIVNKKTSQEKNIFLQIDRILTETGNKSKGTMNRCINEKQKNKIVK